MPLALTVVPAAMVTVTPAISTAPRVCVPVMVWVPAKMMLLAEAVRPPLAVKVQLRVVRKVPVIVSVLVGLLMFTSGRSLAAPPPLQVCGTVPLISSVPVPPVKVEATEMAPWAATVPVFSAPPVRVSVPTTVMVPALMVLEPDRNWTLLNVAPPVSATFTLLVERTTVPLLCVKTPAAKVTAPVTVRVPDVLVKVAPALTVSAPVRLMVELLPLKMPPTVVPPVTPMVEVPPLNVPPTFTAVAPVTVTAVPLPVNVPADWVYDVVRLRVLPAAWLTVPV